MLLATLCSEVLEEWNLGPIGHPKFGDSFKVYIHHQSVLAARGLED